MNRSPGDFSPAFGRCRQKRFGQPWCLMSPIGRKASVEREISPSHLAPSSSSPHCSSPQRVDFSLQFWGYLCKIDLARLLQPRKLGFRYGGSSILLDNPVIINMIGKMIRKTTPSICYQYRSNCTVMYCHLMALLTRASLESSRKDGES